MIYIAIYLLYFLGKGLSDQELAAKLAEADKIKPSDSSSTLEAAPALEGT